MRTRDLVYIGLGLLALYLLWQRQSAGSGARPSGAGAPPPAPGDPWAQRIEAGAGAVQTGYDIITSFFGGGSSSPDGTYE
jgi:hypothetical protein